MVRVQGKGLRVLRESRGLSQAELAKKAGDSQSAVAKWELGQRCPSLYSAVRLAKALDVDLYTLCLAFDIDVTDIPGGGSTDELL